MLPESNEIYEAVRIQPYLVDADGHAFWKLKDLGTWGGTPSGEQWSVCSAKEPTDKEKQAKREERHSKNSLIATAKMCRFRKLLNAIERTWSSVLRQIKLF